MLRSLLRRPLPSLLLMLTLSPALAQNPELQLASGLVAHLDFITESGAAIECDAPISSKESAPLLFGDYELELRLGWESGADILAFSLRRKDLTPFTLAHYSLSVTVPYVRNAGIWSYNQTPRKGNIQFPVGQPFEMDTSANIGIPLAVLADRSGVNLLSVGVLSQHHSVTLRGGPMPGACNQIRIVRLGDKSCHGCALRGWFLHFQGASAAGMKRPRPTRGSSMPTAGISPCRCPLTPTIRPMIPGTGPWTRSASRWCGTWRSARRKSVSKATSLMRVGILSRASTSTGWMAVPETTNRRRSLFPDFAGLLERIRHQIGHAHHAMDAAVCPGSPIHLLPADV